MRKLLASLLVLLTLHYANAQIVGSYPYTFANGTTADATQVNANFSYVQSQVNANAATAGANSNITSLLGLTTPLSGGQGGTQYFSAGTSTGTANAQVISSGIVPTGFSLTAGQIIMFTAGITNTGAMTLNVNSTGATAVKKISTSGLLALTGGEVVLGNVIVAIYDGTEFVILDGLFPLLGKQATIASAATTDLGTALTHNISITGTTNITSFGSSAQIDYPIYFLSFVGAVPITYNATSMIYPGGASQPLTTAAGDTAIALYLGSGNWQIISYTNAALAPISMGIVQTFATKFTQINNNTTPNSKVDLNATKVVVVNSLGYGLQFLSPSTCTINFGTNGAGGLDTGSLATSTWYYTYYISNGSTLSCLGSLSATSPTMPSGYTYSHRVGAIETDGSSNFYRTTQTGRRSVIISSNPSISGTVTYNTSFPSTSEAALVKITSGSSSGNSASVTDMSGIVVCSVGAEPGAGGTVMVCPVQNVGGIGSSPPTTFSISLTSSTAVVYGWLDRANVN